MAKIDYLRVQQVVVNLLSNAIKFSYSNSTIFVEIEQEIFIKDKIQKISVKVEDEGIGMND